jgi:hypothetical protein
MRDHSMLVVECNPAQQQELREYFSFFVPGYRYMPAFKRKVWDGKVRLFNQISKELNVGLCYLTWHQEQALYSSLSYRFW